MQAIYYKCFVEGKPFSREGNLFCKPWPHVLLSFGFSLSFWKVRVKLTLGFNNFCNQNCVIEWLRAPQLAVLALNCPWWNSLSLARFFMLAPPGVWSEEMPGSNPTALRLPLPLSFFVPLLTLHSLPLDTTSHLSTPSNHPIHLRWSASKKGGHQGGRNVPALNAITEKVDVRWLWQSSSKRVPSETSSFATPITTSYLTLSILFPFHFLWAHHSFFHQRLSGSLTSLLPRLLSGLRPWFSLVRLRNFECTL